MLPPSIIVGDLDSLEEETREYFTERGTIVEQLFDQDTTDAQKALQAISRENKLRNIEPALLVFGTSGGFLGHQTANLNLLFENPMKNVFFISEQSISFLLSPGLNEIISPFQLCVNLVPISLPTKVSTEGLKWNLKDQLLKFGELVSSSNLLMKSMCTIYTQSHLLCIFDNR